MTRFSSTIRMHSEQQFTMPYGKRWEIKNNEEIITAILYDVTIINARCQRTAYKTLRTL